MVNNTKKDELISRRELFRKCAKALLPTIAAFAVSTPAVAALKDVQVRDCNGACMIGCNNTCQGSCAMGCTHMCGNSCTNACRGTCRSQCVESCTGTCMHNCYGSCAYSCYEKCSHAASLTTKKDTITINDSIK